MSEPEAEKPASLHPNPTEQAESADESDDESEVLEESPCGRWQKRREEVEQRDVPGIDNAFLAMDTEEGVEVVWNEVQFSEKKNFRAQQDKIRQVFDNLIQLEHPNIVKFHKYWTDTKGEKPRVIFITEYMSSGSLKQFLKLTKKNNKTFQLKAWKRWCTQILSALSYLHSCEPPIIHGNLACDTIFIQHNGLIKIGSESTTSLPCVAPDAIHMHVKTCRENIKNMHCIAPEYGGSSPVTIKVDIYAFGMCALEMAALGIHGNGDGKIVTEEDIEETLNMLENPLQRNFLRLCIQKDPAKRPTARELLFHAVLFEVHSLKLLAAHRFVKSNIYQQENLTDENYFGKWDPNRIIASIPSKGGKPLDWKCSQVPVLEVEKFLEDVKNGIYPLTAFAMITPPSRPRAITPELAESVKSETPEPYDVETRRVTTVSCQIQAAAEGSKYPKLVLQCRMDDKMNRQLLTDMTDDLTPSSLADELVQFGFINELDRDNVAAVLTEAMQSPPKTASNGVGPGPFPLPVPIPSS
ncbi:nuclear receptor-binding protein-like isoform X2 [Babylonia areolata]|uniref:nuclear receptor-binding protein-like isoform X2 n=1 Tax=Babylonia areolata TaxID=304850 RepID=UPI003FD53692